MSSPDQLIIAFLLVVMASSWSLGYYVFLRNRGAGSSRPFLLLTFLIGFWALFSLVSRAIFMSWPEGTLSLHDLPVMLDESTFFAVAFMGPAVLHLILLNLGWNRPKILKRLYLLYLFSLLSLVALCFELMTATPVFHTSFSLHNGVYTAERGAFFYYFLLPYNYIMILTALFLAVWRGVKPRYSMERKNALIIVAAISAGFIANIAQIVTEGNAPIDITFLGFFATTLIFSVAVLKYGLFVVVPVKEESERATKASIPEERVILMHEADAIPLFSEFVGRGFYGLAFTSREIEEFREKSGLQKTTVFRLTENPVRDAINPSLTEHHELLLFIIRDFVSRPEGTVVYLQGLEQFLDAARLKSSIDEISEIVQASENGRLIVVNEDYAADKSE